MRHSEVSFAIATLTPVPLLVGGALAGDLWAIAALCYIAVLVPILDQLIAEADDTALPGSEFPVSLALSRVLALLHFPLLALAVATLAGATGLGWTSRIYLFMAFGLFFGQVSNANAHELIHATRRRDRRLGVAVFTSLLFGHHASAHPLVHHRFVGTAADPASAPLGVGFWRYLPRAWIGGFRAGLKAETARRTASGKRLGLHHPYAIYLAGAAACVALVGWAGGTAALVAYFSLAAYAQLQLLLSDYVQHYGLRRALRADGRPVPVAAAHSWNAPHWMSRHMMLNAPRHSDHHAHPTRPFPALEIPEAAPLLPHSLPTMAVLALFPRHWRRVMDPRVEALRTKQDTAARTRSPMPDVALSNA